ISQNRRDAIVDGLGLGYESLLPGIRGKKLERGIRGLDSKFFIGLERAAAFFGKAHLPRHEEEGAGSRRHRVRGNRIGHAGHANRALLHELLGARMIVSWKIWDIAGNSLECQGQKTDGSQLLGSYVREDDVAAIAPRNGLPGDPMRRERALNIL